MGESLDRGHVMAISLWDDVEVNMLWLDSAYPLDKPATDPGVQRGDCPGGVESTPTYVRQNFPDGWVSFQNAFVGPIGSFLTQPSPPPPTPAPCSAGCGAAEGMNQPECSGQTEMRCRQMMQYENKCQWTACPDPTPMPTPEPTLAPSPAPTPCVMENAAVPEGKRCKGRPVSGWSGLGKDLTQAECQMACIADDACVFAVYRTEDRKCSYFLECSEYKNQAGFIIWEKTCEDELTPNPSCAPFCENADLSAGGEGCDYLSKFPKLCNQACVTEGSSVTPCRAAADACREATPDTLNCPRFNEQCSGEVSLSEIGSHAGEREEKPKGGHKLAKWSFDKWRALIQTGQMVGRVDL